METIKLIFDILILLFLFYLTFIKSYISEKGKNLATKEDISEITKIIEKTRQEFIEKSEVFKHKLSLSTQNSITLNDFNRKSMINYFEKYSCWLNSIIGTNPPLLFEANYIEKSLLLLDQIIADKRSFETSESQLYFFITDPEFTLLNRDLKILTINIQSETQSLLSSDQACYSKCEISKNELNKYTEALNKRNDNITKHVDKQKELLDPVYKKYVEMRNYLYIKYLSTFEI